jgi:hypothetical protein
LAAHKVSVKNLELLYEAMILECGSRSSHCGTGILPVASAGTPAEFAFSDIGCADAREYTSHGQDGHATFASTDGVKIPRNET